MINWADKAWFHVDPPPYLSHAADFLEDPRLFLLLPLLPRCRLCAQLSPTAFSWQHPQHPTLLGQPARAAGFSASSMRIKLLVVWWEKQQRWFINIPSGVVLSHAHPDPEYPSLPFPHGCPPSYQGMRNRLISHLPSARARACVNLSVRDIALCSQEFLSLEIFHN